MSIKHLKEVYLLTARVAENIEENNSNKSFISSS